MATKIKKENTTSLAGKTAKEDVKLTAQEKAEKIMEKLAVKVLWENSRGEYFTEKNFALASEDGKQEKIKEYKK